MHCYRLPEQDALSKPARTAAAVPPVPPPDCSAGECEQTPDCRPGSPHPLRSTSARRDSLPTRVLGVGCRMSGRRGLRRQHSTTAVSDKDARRSSRGCDPEEATETTDPWGATE